MRRGGNALLFTAALATAGCVTDSNQVQIRPIADPFIKATRAGSPALTEGRGLLAMGSVGLAIEAFHKALREQPDSIEALAGLAECYDQMGRHDLSQAKYEAALAIAPKDPALLRTFAASLERQGRLAEATELRGEANANEREEAAALVRIAPVQPIAPPPVKAVAPVRPKPVPVVVAAQAAPVPVAQPKPASAKLAAVQPMPVPAPVKPAVAEPPPAYRPMPAAPQLSSTAVVSRTAWAIEAVPIAPPPEAAASVTVKLPTPTPPRVEPPRAASAPAPAATTAAPRAEPVKIAVAALRHLDAPEVTLAAAPLEPAEATEAVPPSVTVKLPPAHPAAVIPAKPPAPAVRQIIAEATPVREGPRLERLSMGEVALVTDRPRWKPAPVRYTAIANTPRFVPLADLPGNYGLRLLNAARHDGLAAQTRVALNSQGWKSVTIGNSARVRQHSLVLYSEATEQAARRLARKMGIWIAKDARPGPLTVLLGRDWAARRQARA